MKLGLVLLAAAGAISIPVYRIGEQSAVSQHRHLAADIGDLKRALNAYRDTDGSFPATADGLRLLMAQRQLSSCRQTRGSISTFTGSRA